MPVARPLIQDIETISTKPRIPQFWCDKPRLWFVQFETVTTNQKLGYGGRFLLAVTKLEKVDIESIGDIILSPDNTGRFEALKKYSIRLRGLRK